MHLPLINDKPEKVKYLCFPHASKDGSYRSCGNISPLLFFRFGYNFSLDQRNEYISQGNATICHVMINKCHCLAAFKTGGMNGPLPVD